MFNVYLSHCLARRPKNESVSFFAKAFTLLLLLITNFNAKAEEYYWKVSNDWYPHELQDKKPSPELVCRWLQSEYEWENYHPAVNIDGNNWSCDIRWSNGDDYVEDRIPIVRYGDSCASGTEFNQDTGQCETEKGDPDSSCPSSSAGNPINFATGNKYQFETDFILPSYDGQSKPLSFSRFYNSIDGVWTHSYSTRLSIDQYSAAIVHSDGGKSSFELNGDIYTPKLPETGKLIKEGERFVYQSPKNEFLEFDTDGRLTRIQKYGLSQNFTYTGQVIEVTDTLGHSFSFTEDLLHQPTSLETEGLTVTYEFDLYKQLKSVTRAYSGKSEKRQYSYEDSKDSRHLTGIIDERGVRYATWRYDEQGRSISSEHSGGADKVLISYNADGSSTVTNELGKKTTYQFQVIQGIKRITAIDGEPSANCPNSNATFTYDTRGLLKTKTDDKGFITTYDYNDRGLEISRTEASGTAQARTMTTTWHDTLNLPLTVTEPGRVTTYTYDAQGRQLSQTSASTAL